MSIPDPAKKQGYKPEYKPPWPTDEEMALVDAEELDGEEAGLVDQNESGGKPSRGKPRRKMSGRKGRPGKPEQS